MFFSSESALLEKPAIVPIPTHPNITGDEVAIFSSMISAIEAKCVAFLDLACTPNILFLVRALFKKGIRICFFDHHLNDRNRHIADEIKRLSLFARIETRTRALSCTTLVPENLFSESDVDVVFFHDDTDGMMATLRGLGMPNILPDDADILDSGGGLGRSLSRFGKIFSDVQNVLPHPFEDRVAHDLALRDLLHKIACFVRDPGSQTSQVFEEMVEAAAKEGRENAEEIIEDAKPSWKGLLIPNLIPFREQKRPIHIAHLKQVAWRQRGKNLLLCLADWGPNKTSVIQIFVPKELHDHIDLKELIPPNGTCHLSSMAYVSFPDGCEHFIHKWSDFYPLLREKMQESLSSVSPSQEE